MNKLARLHQFWPRHDFRANCFFDTESTNEAWCTVDGSSWGDFGVIDRHTYTNHDYRFILSKRVLDVLHRENLATFDALRIRIDDIGDLRTPDMTPEYYAIKILHCLPLKFYDGIGYNGGLVNYWVPDFATYEGHPFVWAKADHGAEPILTIPKIAELAEKNQWSNCFFMCISSGGYYYSKEVRRKATRTFNWENVRNAKQIFVDEEIVRNDLEAAKQKPQGRIIIPNPPHAASVRHEVPSIEAILSEGISRAHRAKAKELSVFSAETQTWSFACLLDTGFQTNVPAVFELRGSANEFPDSLGDNIGYLSENFSTIWNAFAAQINDLLEPQRIQLPKRCVVDEMRFVFSSDKPASSTAWTLELKIQGLPGLLSADFSGLNLVKAVCVRN